MSVSVDLPLDLNTQDETGLPWTFLDAAPDPSKIRAGAWIVVGGGQAQAVAQVVSIEDGLVHVRPLPGPVRDHAHLLDPHGEGRPSPHPTETGGFRGDPEKP